MADLLVNLAAFEALQQGTDPRRIAENWREKMTEFDQMRQKYLLYK
jgi:uncharacterized protein YbbC (DUF1343 family)